MKGVNNARVIQVIEIQIVEEEFPHRVLMQYWNLDGTFIAEKETVKLRNNGDMEPKSGPHRLPYESSTRK